jgi:hypothetical protein
VSFKEQLRTRTNDERMVQAAADPMNATRDAVGLPTPDCRVSEEGNVSGPSTGGQGAEFRATTAQSESFQVDSHRPQLHASYTKLPLAGRPSMYNTGQSHFLRRKSTLKGKVHHL